LVKSQRIKYTVKRNNVMCIKTEALKFLDITNYMAPGFSYSQFLKAYGCTEDLVGETERQPAATSRSLLQHLEERQHFSG
jgi:hypothetical protein